MSGSSPIRTEDIPLSLYVHWPWCVRKCPYCDFNSHALNLRKPEESEDRYVESLIRELEVLAPQAHSRPFRTVFIGGGTPSLMSVESVGRLLEAISNTVGLERGAEITMEANPGTVEASRFRAYAALGVNRVSLGIQSFSDEKLRILGRIHTAQEALEAARLAAEAFERVNLDLMFGLPGETLPELEETLRRAVSLDTVHLSFYQLTIEEGTYFAKRTPAGIPGEDTLADMTDLVESTLAAAGFRHYEVSGYARPGFECRHNLNYWTYGDYMAIGAGAHAKLSSAQGIVRYQNAPAPVRYMENVKENGTGAQRSFTVPDAERPFEYMLNALRLVDGVPSGYFETRTGLPLARIEPVLSTLRTRGLLVGCPERIATTEKGLRFLSDVQEAFL